MAREYVLNADNLTLANQAVTLAFIRPSDDRSIKIMRVKLGFTGGTTTQRQRVQLVTQGSAFPTLTAATPVKMRRNDPECSIIGGTAGALGTSGINASGEGAGAKTVLMSDGFDILAGWEWMPPPGSEIFLPANSTEGFGVFFPAAAATLSGWNCSVLFREMGA